jgi:hypothetical protein
MSTSISAAQAQSEFRVEKAKTEATLTLSNGTLVHGSFFLAGSAGTHAGPERIKDVLNGAALFFPFEVSGAGKPRTILVNREHVVVARLHGGSEAQSDPGYNVATRRQVSLLLSDGVHLQGTVSVNRPHGHDRLSDFARATERFMYLESDRVTFVVNVRHVVELLEETAQP